MIFQCPLNPISCARTSTSCVQYLGHIFLTMPSSLLLFHDLNYFINFTIHMSRWGQIFYKGALTYICILMQFHMVFSSIFMLHSISYAAWRLKCANVQSLINIEQTWYYTFHKGPTFDFFASRNPQKSKGATLIKCVISSLFNFGQTLHSLVKSKINK